MAKTFRAFHRREAQIPDVEADLPGGRQEAFQNLPVDLRVPYHALFAHLVLPGLKLGLDQAEHLALRLEQAVDHGENQLQ